MVYVTHDQAEAMALADQVAVMDRGQVMQVGAPLEIYHRPRNVFVAGFLGGPPMNLLPGGVDAAAGAFVLAGAENVPIDVGPLIATDGEKVAGARTLGVRPEHIAVLAEPDGAAMQGRVTVVQRLGAETLVTAQVGRHSVVVRLFTDGSDGLPDPLWLRFAPTRLHLFDADGVRI